MVGFAADADQIRHQRGERPRLSPRRRKGYCPVIATPQAVTFVPQGDPDRAFVERLDTLEVRRVTSDLNGWFRLFLRRGDGNELRLHLAQDPMWQQLQPGSVLLEFLGAPRAVSFLGVRWSTIWWSLAATVWVVVLAALLFAIPTRAALASLLSSVGIGGAPRVLGAAAAIQQWSVWAAAGFALFALVRAAFLGGVWVLAVVFGHRFSGESRAYTLRSARQAPVELLLLGSFWAVYLLLDAAGWVGVTGRVVFAALWVTVAILARLVARGSRDS